ncbi:hypothetical protein LJR039_003332 [Pseudorhodoferax sp. LjRoot39]|uniref:helix-turn-helix domain-containing transcriptional regulator n=1 Tax=Pseudorhodoferax sp. LjRoot39 TaxID=3342328 RepID=UPI003ECE6232
MAVFDAVDCLTTEQACAEDLTAALEDGDPALVTAALGDVARALGLQLHVELAASA